MDEFSRFAYNFRRQYTIDDRAIMAWNTSSSIEEMIKCGICYETFDDPRRLPCSHTYCRKCLIKLAPDTQGRLACPLRDNTTVGENEIDSLPVDRSMYDLVELYGKSTIEFGVCTHH